MRERIASSQNQRREYYDMNNFEWNADHEKKLCQRVCWRNIFLSGLCAGKNVFVILFPLMPLIMEMNQPLINADLTSNDLAIRHSSIIRPLMDISVCILQYQPHRRHIRHCAVRLNAYTLYHIATVLLFNDSNIAIYHSAQSSPSNPISNSSTHALISHICSVYVLTLIIATNKCANVSQRSVICNAISNKGTWWVIWNLQLHNTDYDILLTNFYKVSKANLFKFYFITFLFVDCASGHN